MLSPRSATTHFHPLKAGRRLSSESYFCKGRCISIPSRRVGDIARRLLGVVAADFPSPQGGSETSPHRRQFRRSYPFPSPQGGSETRIPSRPCDSTNHLSIPSRRVGDFLSPQVLREQLSLSIPSRRVGDPSEWRVIPVPKEAFHPLKAGRRPTLSGSGFNLPCDFPSPQGGSETVIMYSQLIMCPLLSIPSRRVGDYLLRGLYSYLQEPFHPLKAGRRQCAGGKWEGARVAFHPLKAGRRRLFYLLLCSAAFAFHPLKAGRRP